MDEINICFDSEGFSCKPNGFQIAIVSNRIASQKMELVTNDEIHRFVDDIGINGHTFCPATFRNGKRCKENFEQQQLFALDFDNKDEKHYASFEEVKARAEEYEMPILFAYETFSSSNKDKFRVVFKNDVKITDRPVAEAMQRALSEIFPEADTSCCNDISKMYFGGNKTNLLYFDKTIPDIDVDLVFRSMTYEIKKRKGIKHYKEYIKRIAKTTGIALNQNGLLDVKISDEPPIKPHPTEEKEGAKIIDGENGGNSPSPFIYNNIYYVKRRGENPPLFYNIRFDNNLGTCSSSVSRILQKNPAANHKQYRSSILSEIHKCRLYDKFYRGNKLSHDEIFHILNNMINIETGNRVFLSIIERYPELYDSKTERWKEHVEYNMKQGYFPSSCDKYCPYHDECDHNHNILSTVHPSQKLMERINDSNEKYYPLHEVEADTYNALYKAFLANDEKIHVIKAQTAIGKSTSFLKLIEQNPEQRFLVAVPTNLLKEEMLEKAERSSIDIMATPSLEPIMDEIPFYLSREINRLYACGQANKVHHLIKEVLEKEDIPCLRKYMKRRSKLYTHRGSLITTHRYLLSMDDNRLDEFDCIIIDEDIIFKSVISNQGEITVANLKKAHKTVSDMRIKEKITDIIQQSRKISCIRCDGFKWKNSEDSYDELEIDLPAFCAAEYFVYRSADNDPSIDEDTVAFLKPFSLTERKHIIVSATADEEVYCTFFGDERVDFYECKQAKYKGQLLQYYQKSMSRQCLEKDRSIISQIMDNLSIPSTNTITFKKENIGTLHFGNTEGSNSLEGENIIVAGTPYHADFLYKLVAFSLDIDFDEDEQATSNIITHNGYRTRFTTYRNEDLRAIQLWMLESELEQAVGRARLLRYDCTVHLFSNFPLRQAIMKDNFPL